MKFSSATLAAVAVASFAVATVSVQAADVVIAAAHKVKCEGVNSCKGTSECKTAEHACKGQNECKGHGYISLTAKKCAAKGGKELKDS